MRYLPLLLSALMLYISTKTSFYWEPDKNPKQEEDKMAVKILIKRTVSQARAKEVIPLFRKLRSLAVNQPGYISGETLRRLDKHDEFLVISTWESSDAWKKWIATQERKEVQEKLDSLLGGKTAYEIYHYGFTE
jgi:heme-degrading monooxygenase HmoA